MDRADDTADVQVDSTSGDVGGEGGSPGDVELTRAHEPAAGSEAGEAFWPTVEKVETVRRDETGEGRLSP